MVCIWSYSCYRFSYKRGTCQYWRFNMLFSRRGAENAGVTCVFMQWQYHFIRLPLRSQRLCESKYLYPSHIDNPDCTDIIIVRVWADMTLTVRLNPDCYSLCNRYPSFRYPAIRKNPFTCIIQYWPFSDLASAPAVDTGTFFNAFIDSRVVHQATLFMLPF